jgi:hypothetical protein
MHTLSLYIYCNFGGVIFVRIMGVVEGGGAQQVPSIKMCGKKHLGLVRLIPLSMDWTGLEKL